jgi:four helix bundle protein
MRIADRNAESLLTRTKAFAIRIVRLYNVLPKTGEAQVLGKQLLRSGTSVGAQIAEAGHCKSKADFACKVEGALQELEEARYWMELLVETKIIPLRKLQPLIAESSELIAILITIATRSRRALRASGN